jgi:hypothetical protein
VHELEAGQAIPHATAKKRLLAAVRR